MEIEDGCYGAVKTDENISATDTWIGWLALYSNVTKYMYVNFIM